MTTEKISTGAKLLLEAVGTPRGEINSKVEFHVKLGYKI